MPKTIKPPPDASDSGFFMELDHMRRKRVAIR